MNSLSNLLSRTPSAVSQGLIYAVLAIGIYITFRVLNTSDLTVDGSFTTGGAICIMMILAGYNCILALIVASLSGIICGLVTGLLHTKFRIPVVLSGILTQYALYSVDLRIMKMASNQSANPNKYRLLLSMRNIPKAIVIAFAVVAILIGILYWYFGTEQGSAIRATGCNEIMTKAQGINTDNMKLLGLAISNGIVAFAGGLMAQYQGYADINMGRGTMVIGLAAIIIGEVLTEVIFRKGCQFFTRLSFVAIGGILYYLVIVFILWLKLDPNDLKLFTALVVAVFLALPNLRKGGK